jgi:peptidyl-prolyl cis-trans isomerase D
MLDLMRRQHSKLKWVLVLIIAAISVTFVVQFIPSFSEYSSGVVASDVATIGSESVSAREFQSAYRNNIQRMGSQVSPEMLRAFGFDKQVLDYLIKQRVVTVEARRLGLQVTDTEVQDKVLSTPPFVDAGGFIGHAKYQQLLERNNMTVQEFEEGIRSQLLGDKLRSFLTAGVTVSDADVEKEYRKINEKAKIDYFVIEPAKFESKVTVSDQEQRDFYEKNKTRYQMPEQRKAKYIFIDTVKYHKEATATDQELHDYFNQHVEDYRLKELVSAQHILFKTEGKKPEEVDAIRKKALSVLERIKKGEDFSTLAKQFSEDSTAANGGNLGEFSRNGQMVPEFEKAAFSLGVGAVSDLVQTQYGFHIIKVLKKQEPRLRTFEEMKEAIRSIVLGTKGAAKAEDVSRLVSSELATNKNLDAVAQKYGAEVRTTPMLSAGQKVEGLSNSADFIRQVFSLAKDEIGTAIKNDEGYAILSVAEIQPTHQGTFEETKTRVLADVKSEKAGQMATEKSTEAVAAVKAGKDLATIAKSAGMEIKTSELIARGGSLPDFGAITDRDSEIFSLPVGKTGTPSTVGSKTLVFAVKERKSLDPEEIKKGLDPVRTSLQESKRETIFSNWIDEAMKKMEKDRSIKINQTVLAQITDAAR